MSFYTALFALFFIAIAGRAEADDPQAMWNRGDIGAGDIYAQRSLRGLDGVQVIVHLIPPEVEQNGLTRNAIQADIDQKLHQAGIPTLEPSNLGPFLHVAVSLRTNDPNLWPYHIIIELRQAAILKRDPSITVQFPQTWSAGIYGAVLKQNVSSLRSLVKDQIDKFVNAYLAMNPKQ